MMRTYQKYSFLLFIILFHFQISINAQNPDIKLLRQINLNRNTSLDPVFRGFSNSVAPMMIATPVLLYGFGMIKHDSISRQNAIYIGATLFFSGIIVTAMKYAVNRPRPFKKYPDIEKAAPTNTPSFPSGHTSFAFSLATSLSLDYPKWYVIAPAYLWAGTVAYSRMDLGVHYPSDVLVGAIIGSGSAWLCYKLNQKLRKKW